MSEQACRICRRIVQGNICPIDKGTDLTPNWSGLVVIVDPVNSEIAKALNITSPGKFALRIKD
jgi:DNA-directed RNA polymerase subunit E"